MGCFDVGKRASWRRAARHASLQAFLLLVLVVGPGTLLASLALHDPDVAFLTPASSGTWIRHPRHDVVTSRDVLSATFERQLWSNGPPDGVVLQLRSFGDTQVTVNGIAVAAQKASATWKESSTYDLRSHLELGANSIRIDVRNLRGVPALLVEDPPVLRTPEDWLSTLVGSSEPPVAAVPALFRPPRPGPLQRSSAWRWLESFTTLWAAAWTVVGVAAVVKRRTPAFERILPLAFVVAALALNLSNAEHHPYAHSAFDSAGHEEYVSHVASTWTVPLASDGWQMYHPPLYYFVAALVAHPFERDGRERWTSVVRIFGAATGSVLGAVAWAQLRLLRPSDVRGAWIATGLASFLPVALYTTPLATNEAVAAVLAATAGYAILRAVTAAVPSLRAICLAGLATGVALLTKVSALVVVASGALTLLLAGRSTRSRRWIAPVVFVGAAAVLAGWFYVRNAVHFGDPLIANWSPASGHAFHQEPTFRTVGFFLGSPFKALQEHPTRAIWSSFLGGHYATTWTDAHSSMFAQDDQPTFLAMSLLLLIGLAPSVTTVAGVVAIGLRTLVEPRDASSLLLSSTVVVMGWAMVLLALRAPHYSSIKASYWLSIVPCLSVCFAVGRGRVHRLSPRLGLVLDATSVTCIVLSWVIFRV